MSVFEINDTHDPDRRSWVARANEPDTDFPIQNLPLGVFSNGAGVARCGIAIGDCILDISAANSAGLFSGPAKDAAVAASGSQLNSLFALGIEAASALRKAVADLLTQGSKDEQAANACLVMAADREMLLPAKIGSFTDFLCSDEHSKRMSPTGNLPQHYHSVPIAYHSRATTVRVSGTPLRRPNGQYPSPDGEVTFGPEPAQDFELELGIFVGPGNDLGEPISIESAADHLFGYGLLNDWSARAIQFWEGQPLGPFLGKSLMTTISPWIVTTEALAPFRVPARRRDPDAVPPAHLLDEDDQANGGLDIDLLAYWTTESMRENGAEPVNITRTNFRESYWTPAQMVAHHTSNGCNLEPGDLFGSGTVSGADPTSWACLAEQSEKGTADISIGGESRRYLEDGDEITFRGRATRDGFASIGFGECSGRVLPASR